MATISNTPRPGYVWDSTDNVWYPIGVGGHSHPDYITQATAVNPTIIDAKGDIITATAADTPARLAVGNNGETLVADSSTSTGLRYNANFAAGKNKIINGDFNINQRAFTSTTGQGVFTFDRFKTARGGGTVTYSAQTFTLGTAPVSGYESTNFLRIDSTGQSASSNYTSILQPIESVKTFAGQTVTISFWAKAASGTPKIGVAPEQRFGTGGSPSADLVTSFGDKTISTSWARYSFTGTIPSISGKTLGTAGDDRLIVAIYTSVGSGLTDYPVGVGLQTATIDIWGVQIEAGSVATAFQTATGTIQGELAACQRYYYRSTSSSSSMNLGITCIGQGSTSGQAVMMTKTTLRAAPTSVEYSNLKIDKPGDASFAITSFTLGNCQPNALQFDWSVSSGASMGVSYILQTNTGGGYIGISAEL